MLSWYPNGCYVIKCHTIFVWGKNKETRKDWYHEFMGETMRFGTEYQAQYYMNIYDPRGFIHYKIEFVLIPPT